MIRITRETDYGIVLASFLARHRDRAYSAADLAKHQRLPLPMVSKILKTLTRTGLLTSQRGVKGGYSLSRSPEAISAADIIDALEGPIAMTECTDETLATCIHQGHCSVSGHWQRINHALREALERISLLELSRPQQLQVSLPAIDRPLTAPKHPTHTTS